MNLESFIALENTRLFSKALCESRGIEHLKHNMLNGKRGIFVQ